MLVLSLASRISTTALAPCGGCRSPDHHSMRLLGSSHLGVAIERRVRDRVVGLEGGQEGRVVEEVRGLVEEDSGACARVQLSSVRASTACMGGHTGVGWDGVG